MEGRLASTRLRLVIQAHSSSRSVGRSVDQFGKKKAEASKPCFHSFFYSTNWISSHRERASEWGIRTKSCVLGGRELVAAVAAANGTGLEYKAPQYFYLLVV